MVKNTIPLSLTINVSLASLPSGLGAFNTNSICLFTNEQPLSINPYIWAVSAKEVEQEYGTNSLTAKMARALFTPALNLRTRKGQLLVFPYAGVNATSSSVETEDITENLTNFKLVSDGKLTVAIDGVDYTKTGMDFTQAKSISDVAKILANLGLDCNVTQAGGKIKFTSRCYGTDSTIELKATSGGSGVDIYGATYLNGASVTEVEGVNETGEALLNAVHRAEEVGYFGGILTTQFMSESAIKTFANDNQASEHIYFEGIQSLSDIRSIGSYIKSAGDTKTRLLAYTSEGAEATKQAIATYASIACSTNYSGTDTTLTMNLKQLTGLVADSNMNTTYYNIAKQNGVDIYGSTEGLSCVYSFDNGAYTDEVTADLWLKKALEVALFNVLRQTNTKVPQTEAGVQVLKTACQQVCTQGVRNGMIGTGLQWNGAIPFGNGEDFQRNIKELGFYIYSIPVAEQAQAEREARECPVIQIAIKRAGAIHSADIIVNIQR